MSACLFCHTVLRWIAQWCKVNLKVAFQGESYFLQILSYSWKAYPQFSMTEEKGCFIAPCEWMKKERQFDFTPTIAGDFCQPISSSTHNCCTTGMTRTTTSVSTAHYLVRHFSCFRNTSKYSCICLLMQTRRKWRHTASWTQKEQAGHKKTDLLLP